MIHPATGIQAFEARESLGFDIREYFSMFRRRWWVVLGGMVVCVGAAMWSQRGAIPTYTAEVLLQQRREVAVVGIATSLSGGGFGSQVAILRSRAVLAPVVDSLGLQVAFSSHQDQRTHLVAAANVDRDAQTRSYTLDVSNEPALLLTGSPSQVVSGLSPDGVLEGPDFRLTLRNLPSLTEPLEFSIRNYEVTVEGLRDRVQIQQGGGNDLLLVRYSSSDPELAAAVANGVAESYQRHRMLEARQAAARRRQVVAIEMEHLADSVRQAQATLDNYQATSQLLDPNIEGNALMSALLETDNESRILRFERTLLEGLVAGLQVGDEEDESLSRIMTLGRELVPAGPALDQRLQDLQAERRALTVNRFGVTASSPEVEVLDAQIASTREQMRITAEQSLALLQARLDAANERVTDLQRQLGGLPARASEYVRLQQQVDAIQGVFDRLVGSYYEAQISESVEAGDVALVDPAPIPLSPDPSAMTLNLLIALLGGLVVGLVGALLMEHLDTKVRQPVDARRATGLEVLGEVPRIAIGAGRTSKSVQVGMEAFRSIVTNLRYVMSDGPQLLGICSSGPGEGKSTVTANLALSMVENGDRVLVVDADLRRSRVHELLDVERAPGLREALAGEVGLSDSIQISPLHPALHVLSSGAVDGQTITSLAQHEVLAELLKGLRQRYDRILIDTPPVLAVNDSSVVASLVDGNIVVVRSQNTDCEALEAAVAQLRRVRAKLFGIVLNDMRLDSVGYSAYYTSYYDIDSDEPTPGWKRRRSRSKALAAGPAATE